MLEIIRKPQAKLALAMLSFQFSTLVFFLFLKAQTDDVFFSHFIAVMSVTAVTGSIASFRSEVLIYQADRRVSIRILLLPVSLSLVSTILLLALGLLWPSVFGSELPTYALLISFGYAFQQIVQFILIQLGQLTNLLYLKAAQSILVIIICPAMMLGVDAYDAAMGYGVALAAPVSVWATIWLWRQRRVHVASFRPNLIMIRRGFVLSGTVFVNTAAINLPTILSAATQPAQYAADFGFLMKVMAAPLALSSAMFGQLFLASNIGRDLRIRNEVKAVRRSMIQTALSGVGFVAFCALAMVAGTYVLAWIMPRALDHPSLIFPIVIAALAQASFNPISSVGEIARIESRLIAFYVARAALLYLMLSTVWPIAFEWLFALLSVMIFGTLWFVTDRNLARIERSSV